MSIENLKNALPDYARDIRLNLSSLAEDETLSAQQLWGTFLACAFTCGNADLIRGIGAEAARHLSPEAQEAAKAASAIMAMNNVYYKFTGFMEDYRPMPARLRMSFIGNPGVDKGDFELWSVAVSSINGCQFCVVAHEKKLREEGFTAEQVQTAVRIAAVVRAAASVLTGEQALQSAVARAA